MIGRLNGILLEKQLPYILLDVNGVAYELEVPLNTFYQLPMVGERVILHVHFIVREDSQLLYGFYDLQEQRLFRHLIKVNTIGPKLAVSILSAMAPENFVRCVLENDVSSLTHLPGVGKKTAERLIIEMRDRLVSWVPVPAAKPAPSLNKLSSQRSDAVQALISLGYKPHEASRAIDKIKEDNFSSADLIRQALQQS